MSTQEKAKAEKNIIYMLNCCHLDSDVGKKFWKRLQKEPRVTRTSIVNTALRFYFNNQ